MSIDFGNDIYEEPIVAKTFLAEDAQESSLRPKTLAEYIGQEKAKENLSIFIQAARKRQESLDHVLLHGPPGLGKTTLAGIIAQEMGVNIRITSGPAIEKPGDLAALLTNLNEGDILFVDEIHRLNRSVEEILYPAMEDYALDIIVGKGPSANSIRLDLPHFTLIGATTRAGQLSAPLRDRFGVTLRLELYTPEELSKIVTRSAGILNCDIVPEGAYEIARRSRGTPRIANRMLRRVRDFAEVKADGTITDTVADQALQALDHAQQRGLARAVLADDAVAVARADDPVHVVEDRLVVEAHAQQTLRLVVAVGKDDRRGAQQASVCGHAVAVDQRLAVALTETLEHGKSCRGKRRAERTAAVQSAGDEDQRTAFGPEVEQRQLIILTEHLPEELDQSVVFLQQWMTHPGTPRFQKCRLVILYFKIQMLVKTRKRYGCVRINVQNCIKNTEKQGKTTKKSENLKRGKICRKSKGKSIFSLTCRTKNTGKMKNAQEIQEEARRNSWEIT